MKERPILFSGSMVNAILEGRKTMTRRVVNPQPRKCRSGWEWVTRKATWHWPGGLHTCLYGQPGDRLWVRETICSHRGFGFPLGSSPQRNTLGELVWSYNADHLEPDSVTTRKPSIFMPRWASRITLEIVDIRVERLQAIGIDEISAEGFEVPVSSEGCPPGKVKLLTRLTDKHNHPPIAYLPKKPTADDFYRAEFASGWDGLNSKRGFGWKTNPRVWVLEFRRVKPKRTPKEVNQNAN